MDRTVTDVKLKALEAAFRVKLDYVIFPLEFRELREVLARNGFELSRLPSPIPPRPARVSYSGEIARKDEYVLNISSSECIVEITGRSMVKTFEAFEELTKLIKRELDIDLNENVHYYAVRAHYNLDTGKEPAQEIDRVIEGNSYFQKFDKILGKPTSVFCVRLIPKGKVPNQEDWFDISIEPDVLKPQVYHIGVVFRNSDREKSINFVNSLEKTLEKLVEVIEE